MREEVRRKSDIQRQKATNNKKKARMVNVLESMHDFFGFLNLNSC